MFRGACPGFFATVRFYSGSAPAMNSNDDSAYSAFKPAVRLIKGRSVALDVVLQLRRKDQKLLR